VTLAVLALAAALVAPAVGRTTETLRARAEVARLSALLRHVREQAVVTGEPHRVVVDPAAGRITVLAGEDVREVRALPDDVQIDAEPPTALTVRFEPHGAATGGAFLVRARGVRYRVAVDAVTGRVRVERR
jgi:Tfp pilus assembly protein FimT